MNRLCCNLSCHSIFRAAVRNLKLGIGLCLFVFSTTAFAQTFPYTAYVTGEQVYARSGPGQRHYPTNQLSRSAAVEVYRHDANGWCAIRPPQNSYSWLASHDVRVVSPGVVEVLGKNVVSRVGSTLSTSRTAVQVLLPQGEQLQMLAITESDDPRWIRIAAPAGEFRWIAAASLARQVPPIRQSLTQAAPLPRSQNPASPNVDRSDAGPASGLGWVRRSNRLTKADAAKLRAQQASSFQHLQQAPKPSGVMVASNQQPTQAPVQQQIRIVAGSPADLQLTQYAAPTLLETPTPGISTATSTSIQAQALSASQPRVQFNSQATTLTTATPFAKVASVEELELRLSQAVVSPPQQWILQPIEAAANALLAETKSPAVRAQLREVLVRITRFQTVQNRYQNPGPIVVPERDPFVAMTSATTTAGLGSLGHGPATATATLTTVPASLSSMPEDFLDGKRTPHDLKGLTGLSSTIRDRVRKDLAIQPRTPLLQKPTSRTSSGNTNGRPRAAGTKSLYDATGTLKPVISKRKNSPKYALVDESGKVVSFVTSTPNLNLKPYLGQRIGVHGKRGFIPEYRRAHVTVGRVTPLTRTARR